MNFTVTSLLYIIYTVHSNSVLRVVFVCLPVSFFEGAGGG